MLTKEIRDILKIDLEDKLTYRKDTEIFTFKTNTTRSPGHVVGEMKIVLAPYEPEILEFYRTSSITVIVRFILRNRME